MKKRLLSMLLTLCMIVSLLPVTAMAEEIHTPIGGGGEIISFAPLTETEKTVLLGTSSEDLNLPQSLSATVRVAAATDESEADDAAQEAPQQGDADEPVLDSGEPAQGDEPSVDTDGGDAPADDEPQEGTPPDAQEPSFMNIDISVPVEWISTPNMTAIQRGFMLSPQKSKALLLAQSRLLSP